MDASKDFEPGVGPADTSLGRFMDRIAIMIAIRAGGRPTCEALKQCFTRWAIESFSEVYKNRRGRK